MTKTKEHERRRITCVSREESMTKSNVNPDHYKTAGRERQGENIVQEIHKQKLTQADAARAGQPGAPNFIPGAAPVGERQNEAADDAAPSGGTTGQVIESANSSSST
jgi:hypothetical protein